MHNTGVIDHFLDVFTRYIDSGFGLLQGEVAWLATTLIAIDVTLAALFWTWGDGEDIIARLVKKTLFVGAFAYLIGNWNSLNRIVFESFAGLGLKASGTSLALADFLRPGRIAQTGLDAAHIRLLDAISKLTGISDIAGNLPTILILLVAWAVVILSFFVLAIQLFVALLEFKLTSLAGFVLVPFGLFGKTAFMAERVLGNVISSGIKVLVLAVIVGIGSTLFAEIVVDYGGTPPTVDDAMSTVLASLVAAWPWHLRPRYCQRHRRRRPTAGCGCRGRYRTWPQAVARWRSLVPAASPLVVPPAPPAVLRRAALTPRVPRAAPTETVARSASPEQVRPPSANPLRRAASNLSGAYTAGASGMPANSAGTTAPGGGPPAWARAMRRRQQMAQGTSLATSAVRSGDGGGAGSSINLSEGS